MKWSFERESINFECHFVTSFRCGSYWLSSLSCAPLTLVPVINKFIFRWKRSVIDVCRRRRSWRSASLLSVSTTVAVELLSRGKLTVWFAESNSIIKTSNYSQTKPTKTCEETHCLIEQNGQLMGTPDCRRYALEQLSDNNRKPIIQWLEELENERLSYIDEVLTVGFSAMNKILF